MRFSDRVNTNSAPPFGGGARSGKAGRFDNTRADPAVARVGAARYRARVRRGFALVILAIVCAACGAMTGGTPVAEKKRSEDRLNIAKDFLHKHELEAADSECEKALAYDHDNDEAYVLRGLISMVRALDTQRTMEIDSCLTGLDLEASQKDLDTHLHKADLDFESAVKLSPDYSEAWADRGVVHNLLEDYANAADYLTKALENPVRLTDAGLTRANLGWSMFHMEKYVDAANQLRQALQFKPKMCVATYRLGRVYFARQEWEKAAESFQLVVEDSSCGSQEASYYLMKTRMQQGLVAEAKDARDACLKMSDKSCIASQCRSDGAALR
jgi:Tfp pilus assembly protein PilF